MKANLHSFLRFLQEEFPGEMVRITKPLSPADFDATAILQHLENDDQYPLVLFERPKNLKGEISQFPLVTNVFASRARCALALGLPPDAWQLPLSLEYARREAARARPELVTKEKAPVKAVVRTGDDVDLRDFPIVRHHGMDPAPYIDMALVMRDPVGGAYNTAFLRTMYQGPRTLGLWMSPRHNWQITRRFEERGLLTPVVIVVSHHPAFYLGALNVSPFGEDDYEIIGSMMGQPLALTPSETWGDEFLVPADADILIEGKVLPGIREAEGPFGEFPGYYGPQRLSRVIEVTAVTHRQGAVYQDTFVGHRDTWILGSIPKEGSLYNRVKGVVPTVKAIHLPISGCGRYNCYLAIDKMVDGESKQAALIVLGDCDFVKNVVVVDADIDPFNEQQVLWAVATRTQADQDVDIIRNSKGNALDPSQTDDIMGAKLIIDATRPVQRPFAKRLDVPPEALDRVRLEDFLPCETSRQVAGGRRRGGEDFLGHVS
ncbi:MAG: UbiD family decarboxylase [Chloroflexi bacterium]|nr:UbiD family decarboxylase [Chloroflexota bacterium]